MARVSLLIIGETLRQIEGGRWGVRDIYKRRVQKKRERKARESENLKWAEWKWMCEWENQKIKSIYYVYLNS